MSRYYESIQALHQQAGALTLQAFAEREGMTLAQVMRYVRSGWILGAKQDGRSKRWSIFPPAKLLRDKPRRDKCAIPYTGSRVIQAAHDLKLITTMQPVCVSLTGAQALVIEIALQQAGESIKAQREKDEDFALDFRAGYGDKLNNIFAAFSPAVENSRRPQAAQSGFPTACADRSNDLTEAQAGARRGVSSAMGIPEGGKSSAPSGCAPEEPAFSLPGAFAFDVAHSSGACHEQTA